MLVPYEFPESSSPIVTRAVASGLRGEYCNNYQFPVWQKLLLTGMGALPQGVARFTISRFESISGLNPKVLDDFSMDTLVTAPVEGLCQFNRSFFSNCRWGSPQRCSRLFVACTGWAIFTSGLRCQPETRFVQR